jgi:hypothetical protein
MANSFLNEHSAEFVIVPAFGAILATEFETVIPLYYWSSREGGLLSQQSLVDRQVLIVALFARRPKVDRLSQPYIDVKFNDRLFRLAAFLEDRHIPVFAGVPLPSSLDQFHQTTPSSWFRLPGRGQEEIVRISLAGGPMKSPRFVIPLDAGSIVHSLTVVCRGQSWRTVLSLFQEIKGGAVPGYSRHSMYGDVYKPVYFVMPLLPPSPFFQKSKKLAL